MNNVIQVVSSKESKLIRVAFIMLGLATLYRLAVFVSLVVFPLPEALASDFSSAYYYADKTPAWFGLNKSEQYRVFCPLRDMSGYITKGIVEYEDKWFYLHPGANPASILRALILNAGSGKIVSGGSTISMQLARLAEPRERTIASKLIELFRALQLEAVLGKRRILELYLNTIPMGGNIQGIEAASFFYFGKRARDLTFGESSLLIGISNAPNRNRPDRFPDNAFAMRRRVGLRISHSFGIRDPELEAILSPPVIPTLKSFDTTIIPLVERFDDAQSAFTRVFTIDKRLQDMCLSILGEKMMREDLTNGAVILADNKTMEVKAYIGSPFYSLDKGAVHFNAAATRRSPGSTLKPFIYGRALEEGIIAQKTKVLDMPFDFRGYTPKNYSNTYLGVVSADEALYRSLNIPAIVIEQKLGDKGIGSVLKNCGILSFDDRIDPRDLSVVLGSYPLTLENLVALYASLANKGIYAPLEFFDEDQAGATRNRKDKRIMSEEACFVIGEMLSEGYRPDLHASWEFTTDLPKIAFKTGTGYGFVDAWTIAYTPAYTVGVWNGRLDNRYSGKLTGSETTAPVAFRILDELSRENDEWFPKPDRVLTRKVCAVSGMPAGRYCTTTTGEYYIEGLSPAGACDVHRRIIVDAVTGKAVAPASITDTGKYEERIVEVWPDEIARFMSKYGKETEKLPVGDYSGAGSGRIAIASPDDDSTYTIYLGKKNDSQKIRCDAYPYPDSERFYWYANVEFIGSSLPRDSLFFIPKEKQIEVSVVDEKGRTGNVTIGVSFVR